VVLNNEDKIMQQMITDNATDGWRTRLRARVRADTFNICCSLMFCSLWFTFFCFGVSYACKKVAMMTISLLT